MKSIFYLLLLLVFCCFACNKDDPADFRIVDAVTKEGIPNALVALYKLEGGDIWNPGTRVFLEQTYTNERGEYEFTSDLKDGIFSLTSDADRYWPTDGYDFPRQKILELDPEGYVKVKVSKVDTTTYGTFYSPWAGIIFSGSVIDTSYLDVKMGNQNIHYTWSTYSNGESKTVTGEEFYVPPHDTTTFEIVF